MLPLLPQWVHSLLALLLVAALTPVSVSPRPLTVQPEITTIARVEPEAIIPVLVQKRTRDRSVEAWVTHWGGKVTRDLAIINGFAAEVPAQAVAKLGRLAGVRWISLDSMVESNGLSQARYYLYPPAEGVDSPAQSVLPLSQQPPSTATLANYDTDRDGAAGLLLRREDGMALGTGSGTSQRWQLGPFVEDMRLVGNAHLQLYASSKAYEPTTATLSAYLVHVDAGGQQVAIMASGAITQEWASRWQGAKIKFHGLDYFLKAGDSLELVLTVDSASEDDLLLAFGTCLYPAYLRANLHYALLSAKDFYLVNDPVEPVADTLSHPVLPLHYLAPKETKLHNYDMDRDQGPGIVLDRGGTLDSAPDSGKIQRWRLRTFKETTQLGPNASLEFYAAVKHFHARRYGKIWAHLLHVDENGQLVQVLGSGLTESDDWGESWQLRTIHFGNATHVLPAGHHLDVALTVDASSIQSMWIAYGSATYPSHLNASFWPLAPMYYLDAIGAPAVWASGYEGQGVRVAVIDSGIEAGAPDFMESGPDGLRSRVVANVGMVTDAADQFGHGTFVAGVIGSNGASSGGYYKGVAPKADLLNVRVSDEWGAARESDVVAAMQWVLEHKDEYDIRVVNMSLNSSQEVSYHRSPLNAAAEILWFNGIVVVVSAGNNGSTAPGVVYPPANDPFLIAVGSTDDMETADPSDDVLAADFSAFGATLEGYSRPDLAAPGVFVVSVLAETSNFQQLFPMYHLGVLDQQGELVKLSFSASGTSISSGVVAGAAALLLQALPELNPDQVKHLLIASATPMPGQPGAGAGQLNVARAVEMALGYGSAAEVPAVNTGYPPSQLLTTGSDPIQWNSVNWNSVNWNSVNWNSVNWNSVNWNSTERDEQAHSAAQAPAAAGSTGDDPVIYGGHVLRPPLAMEELEEVLPDTPQTPVEVEVPTEPGTLPTPDIPKLPENPKLPAEPDFPAEPEAPPVQLYLPAIP